MNCPKCNRENEEGAMYCRHCGSPMHPVENAESNTSSILLLIWVVVTCVTSLATMLINNFTSWYSDGSTKMLYIGIQIIQNIACLLPAIAIKNKILKIIGIIIMSILVIWWILHNIQWAMSSY